MGSNSEEKVRAWLSDVFVACSMDLEPTFFPLGSQESQKLLDQAYYNMLSDGDKHYTKVD